MTTAVFFILLIIVGGIAKLYFRHKYSVEEYLKGIERAQRHNEIVRQKTHS